MTLFLRNLLRIALGLIKVCLISVLVIPTLFIAIAGGLSVIGNGSDDFAWDWLDWLLHWDEKIKIK